MNRSHVIAVAVALGIAGCATDPRIAEGRRLLSEGKTEEGLQLLERAARDNPTSAAARGAYETNREALLGQLLASAEAARAAGRYDEAEADYRRAMRIAPASPYPPNGIAAVERARRETRLLAEAAEALKKGDLAAAEAGARAVLAENASSRVARAIMQTVQSRRTEGDLRTPQLEAALARPISVEFRDAPLRSIFEVISRGYGINFVFDRDVRPDLRTTIYVKDGNLDEVIRLLLLTNQLERKVLNENTVLVYPRTPQKIREYQELVVRSFYLANADPKLTAAMVRSLVKTRDIFIDEKLNLLVIKDTPEAVQLAERLVAAQDLGEPEVMLEVEVMEVQSSRLQELGIKYPEQVNYSLPPVTGAAGAAATFPPVYQLGENGLRFFTNNPVLIANLRATVGEGNLLANPRIRVRNRDKARIHIGERVPVVTSTTSVNVGVSTSVSYLDVGLKLDVEPNVHLDDDVAIKVGLEVSNILEQIVTNNTVAYRLGTRTAATTLRLRDGETQVLAGLINDEERKTSSRVPGLGDLPTLGRLFSSDLDETRKTEIVLLITPRIVRNLATPITVPSAFAVGTETSVGAPPLRTRAAALSLASAGGAAPQGAAVPGAATRPALASAQPTAAAPEFALLFAAPAQAAPGSEFSVRFGVPVGAAARSVEVVVAYDPKAVAPVGASPTAAGRVTLDVAGAEVPGAQPPPTELRFRVLPEAAGSTDIRVESARGVDAAGNAVGVAAPGAHRVAIVADR
ncbi:MAG: general secretion pathway protein GspD [Burkholderiales bacterium]|nr:general secretion pathway protein GspD [Burkholderiales bacterium]